MKAEGIYTHLSVYFPLWFTPRPDHPWLEGYDGKSHPFAALMFNPKVPGKISGLVESNPHRRRVKSTGKSLIEEPALFRRRSAE
jgi:hypothetical protein